MMKDGCRLVTRSDFDGLVCAILLNEVNIIDRVQFAHPSDLQHNLLTVTNEDIIANLPFDENAYLVFDHHISEALRNKNKPENYILDPTAPSAARVIYDHFGGKERFDHLEFFEMMAAVDKCDSGQFTREEILDPKEWVLLNFLMDSRTGLGRFKDFRISNYDLMLDLVELCRELPCAEVLNTPDVKERVSLFFQHVDPSKEQIKRCTRFVGNIGIYDLRNEETIFVQNRFQIYAMFPKINISITMMLDKEGSNTVLTVGKSVINRTSKTNIGPLLLKYGGGGHANAGGCQISHSHVEQVLQELIDQITADG